jgi:hypothetical protein
MIRIATHCLVIDEVTPPVFNCVIELSDEGTLLRILPFTEETENTLWHRGTLNLDTFRKELIRERAELGAEG